MRHRAQHVLDGVDRLQDHHFAERLLLLRVAVASSASSAAVRVGVADRGHYLVGRGAVGNLFRGQQIVGDRIVVAATAIIRCEAKKIGQGTGCFICSETLGGFTWI